MPPGTRPELAGGQSGGVAAGRAPGDRERKPHPVPSTDDGDAGVARVLRYFAYGSNMSSARLLARTPGARPLGTFILDHHDLRFHKRGRDGSGKCDAFFTGLDSDSVHGVLFEIAVHEKRALDRIEGLGAGYDEKQVSVRSRDGVRVSATTYVATDIAAQLSPFSWYLQHVIVGAREAPLPEQYLRRKILAVEAMADHDPARDWRERGLHR